MPELIRFYIKNCIIGFGLAAVFTGAIMWFNVANLWHLISTSDIGILAVIVFWVLNGIVFAGVQFAVAIMLMADPEDKDEGPRKGLGVPVRIPAEATSGAARDNLFK
ncbi:hypothetical protein OS189_02735 [Sulfitobacter sp. F26169L]|uniref:hypothetical protein n=1 Tax=Sulfitobacter sp. F26169L TaxID=2996015 RepID=UPI0022609E8F|nr:hypothetical protein [Sulfitobacter sp. F26169L]MCX7565259.1 hypothetical protein [Sulfitobacter sp. F26169L]